MSSLNAPPPIITLSDSSDYLAVSFSWGEAIQHALEHVVVDEGQPHPVSLDEFVFFDGIGRSIAVDLQELMPLSQPGDRRVEVRRRIGYIMHNIESVKPRPAPWSDVLDLPFEETSFECFAWKLAAHLQKAEDEGQGLDPHRRGYFHNLCHGIFRH